MARTVNDSHDLNAGLNFAVKNQVPADGKVAEIRMALFIFSAVVFLGVAVPFVGSGPLGCCARFRLLRQLAYGFPEVGRVLRSSSLRPDR